MNHFIIIHQKGLLEFKYQNAMSLRLLNEKAV